MTTKSALGTGATITWTFDAPNQALSFTATYQQIGGLGRSLAVLDDTSLSSTDYMEKRLGDLIDCDERECQIFADPGVEIPLGIKGVYTISIPPREDQSTPATFTASGSISGDNGADLAPNTIQEATYRILTDGKKTKPTWTPAA